MKLLSILFLLFGNMNFALTQDKGGVSEHRSIVRKKRDVIKDNLIPLSNPSLSLDIGNRGLVLSIPRYSVGIVNEEQIDRHFFSCVSPPRNVVITNRNVSGYSAFSLHSYTGFNSCPKYINVKFAPSSEGKYSGKYCETGYSLEEHDPKETATSCMNLHMTILNEWEDPESKEYFCSSVVRPDSKSVSEHIPVQGADFSLVYSSLYSQNYKTNYINPVLHNSFSPEGLTISHHHYYNKVEKRLFTGTGDVFKREFIEDVPLGEIKVHYQNDILVFDSIVGKHLRTLSGLTGAIKKQFIYNLENKLIKIINSHGKETNLIRNSSGELTSIESPYGEITTIILNADKIVSSVVSPNGKIYGLSYDDYSKFLKDFTKPNGNITSFEFTTVGWLKKESKSDGTSWRFDHYIDEDNTGFTANERISSLERYYTSTTIKENVDGRFERINYSPFGQETRFTEGLDRSTTWERGGELIETETINDERFGNLYPRVNSITHSIGDKIKSESSLITLTGAGSPGDYFNFNQLTTTNIINGLSWINVFDKTTMSSTSTSPEGIESKVVLDNHEMPISIQHGNDTPLTIAYDEDGRISSSRQGTRNKISYGYNSKGRVSWVKNALDQKTSYTYHASGQVGRITLPDGRFTRFQYNPMGQITKVIPAHGFEHVFAFNKMGLTSTYRPPAIPETTTPETRYVYNKDEQMTTIVRPDGKRIEFNYEEEMGQLMSILLDDGEKQTFSYYPLSDKVKVARSPDQVRSVFNYLGESLLSRERQTIGAVSESIVDFGYDNFFRINKRVVKLGGSEVSRYGVTYNNDGAVTKIGDLVLTYDSVSGRPLVTRLKNIRDVKTYDSFGNLKTYKASLSIAGTPETELYYYSLTRDLLHRIVTKVERVQGITSTFEYSYDSVGRLSSVTKNGIIDSSFTYDLNSNRTSGTQNGVSFSATFDNQDRILSYSRVGFPVQTFNYNNNGELLKKVSGTDETLFSSDTLGRLKSVTFPDLSVVEYKLDWDGRRVSRSRNSIETARHAYENTFRIAASREGATTKEYIHSTSINSPDQLNVDGVLHRVIKDHLGSPRLVVNADTGAVVQRMDYNEWGEVLLDTNPGFQAYGFAGGIYDVDTKLVKFGARDYDPEVGRWLSKDPIKFDGNDTNLYGYVMQDPINFIDPSGLVAWGQVGGGVLQFGLGSGLVVLGISTGTAIAAGTGSLAVPVGYVVGGGIVAVGGNLIINGLQDIISGFNDQPSSTNANASVNKCK